MAINIKLSLVDIDFNNINLTLVDGLSLDKLKIRYLWIFNAVIENAIIGENAYGLVWYGGNWLDGEWYDGTWYSGEFRQGVWKNGNFYSYKLNKYDITNGKLNILDNNDTYSIMTKTTWQNGNFYGGTFGMDYSVNEILIPWVNYSNIDITNNVMNVCIWKNGNFYAGKFYNSIWKNGAWYNGTMTNVQWYDGNFYNGYFNGYAWYDGYFLGGDFIFGDWYNGNFSMLDKNIKSRFGCTTDNTPIKILNGYINTQTEYSTPLEVIENNSTNNLAWLSDDIITDIKIPLINKVKCNQVRHLFDLKLTNLLTFKYTNFNINDDCTILGIQVKVSAYKESDNNSIGTVKDVYVGISKTIIDDHIITNKAKNSGLTNLVNNTPIFNFNYGGSTDLWGETWTPADINNENFNIKLQYSLIKDTVDELNMFITGFQVCIYYKTPEYIYNYTKCTWHNGNFNNGEFHSGLYLDSNNNTKISENNNLSVWKNGIFNNGNWFGGKFENGTWNNGKFHSGFFGQNINLNELILYNGTYIPAPLWVNGTFYNGYWKNGTFVDGDFNSGLCENIKILGGNFGK